MAIMTMLTKTGFLAENVKIDTGPPLDSDNYRNNERAVKRLQTGGAHNTKSRNCEVVKLHCPLRAPFEAAKVWKWQQEGGCRRGLFSNGSKG
jgi:hypothetical protein